MQASSLREGLQRSLIGACILEPVMQGAGGMIMPDPAFQRAMVRVCRQQGIPVIFDEVFSGLWRLGTASAAKQLGVQPDIACYAKLLTGTYSAQVLRDLIVSFCWSPHQCLALGLGLLVEINHGSRLGL